VVISWCAAAALAATVQLQVEPESLVAGQTGRARVLVVSGGRGDAQANTSRPPMLAVQDGLQAGYVGQMSKFEARNGSITQVLQFDYRLTALQEGVWTVGPVQVALDDGTTAVARAVRVAVGPRPELGEERAAVVVEAGFDVREAVEGQVVLYRYLIRTTHAGATAEWRLPAFDGLRRPQLGKTAIREYSVDDPDGVIQVQEGLYPLIATGTGQRDQNAAIATVKIPLGRADMFGFRRVRSEPWATERAELRVVPLPPPPPGYSGLVGDFEVISRVDKRLAAVGQSIAWTVQIVGNGALEGYSLPPYEAPGAIVYEDDSRVVGRVEGSEYVSGAAFHRVVVPTEEGALQPPPLSLITFSPTRREYVTHNVDLPTITVMPGREGTGEVTSFGSPGDAADPVDLAAPQEIRPTGPDTTLRLSALMPALLLVAALPGLLVLWASAAGWALRRARDRRAARQGAVSPASLVRSLPSDPEERWAALDAALTATRASEDGPVLSALHAQVLRVRFAGHAPDAELEDEVLRAVRGVAA